MQVLHAKYGQMQGWNSLFGLLSELLIFGEQIARFCELMSKIAIRS